MGLLRLQGGWHNPLVCMNESFVRKTDANKQLVRLAYMSVPVRAKGSFLPKPIPSLLLTTPWENRTAAVPEASRGNPGAGGGE